jgi:hypothetical protein
MVIECLRVGRFLLAEISIAYYYPVLAKAADK